MSITFPCRHCGKPTFMLGTKECDGCHELRIRVQRDPELALRMLGEQLAPPKDHEIREAINKLRDIAVQFHATDQLRERIASVVLNLVKGRRA